MKTKLIALICMLASTSLVMAEKPGGPKGKGVEREQKRQELETGGKLEKSQQDRDKEIKKAVESLNKPSKFIKPGTQTTDRVSEGAQKSKGASSVEAKDSHSEIAKPKTPAGGTTGMGGGRGTAPKAEADAASDAVQEAGKLAKVSDGLKNQFIDGLKSIEGFDATSKEGKEFIRLALTKLSMAETVAESQNPPGTVDPELLTEIINLVKNSEAFMKSVKIGPDGKERTPDEIKAMTRVLLAATGLKASQIHMIPAAIQGFRKSDPSGMAERGALKLAEVYAKAFEKGTNDAESEKLGQDAIKEFIEQLKKDKKLTDEEAKALKICCEQNGLGAVAAALGKLR